MTLITNFTYDSFIIQYHSRIMFPNELANKVRVTQVIFNVVEQIYTCSEIDLPARLNSHIFIVS